MDYTVGENDCFSNIAERFGFSWEKLWNHPDNAELKQKRKNPNILYPGDVIHIPDKELHEVSRPTEKRHRFQKLSQTVLLRLRLLEDGQPRRNLSYTLEVEGQTFSGATDGDGKLEHKIPAKSSVGRLITTEDSYMLNIGRLDPVTEIAGVQERLKNLGYLGDAADGVLTENTKAAIKTFQEKHHLDATGEITEQTRNKLAEIHGT
jgi:hypothetical protein